MKNVFNWRYTPVLQLVAVLLGCFFLTHTLFADGPESTPYTHLYYRHFLLDAKPRPRHELVQHRLPYFDESDMIQSEQRKVISPNAGQILDVHEKYVICREQLYGIAEINIETGESTELIQHQEVIKLNDDHNDLLMMTARSGRVQRYNLKTKKVERLFLPDSYSGIPAIPHNRMSLSPDGQRLALVTFSPKKKDEILGTRFRVDIVDLAAEGTPSKLLTNEAYGKIAMTGGGDHVVGSPIVWKDEETVVLLVSKPQKPFDPKQPSLLQGNVITVEDAPTQSRLVTFNITTGEEHEICKVETPSELINLRIFDHQLWRRSDGEVMLSSNDGDDSRIDFSQNKLVEDSRLSQHYEFRRSKEFGTLLYHGAVLAKGVKTTDLSIAPDGRAVVWLEAQQQNRFPNPNAERSLQYHSLTTGQLKLTTGVFRSEMRRESNHPSDNGMFLWNK